MKVRLTGSFQELAKINTILGQSNKLYPNRNSDNYRLYLDLSFDQIVAMFQLEENNRKLPQPRPFDAVLGENQKT